MPLKEILNPALDGMSMPQTPAICTPGVISSLYSIVAFDRSLAYFEYSCYTGEALGDTVHPVRQLIIAVFKRKTKYLMGYRDSNSMKNHKMQDKV